MNIARAILTNVAVVGPVLVARCSEDGSTAARCLRCGLIADYPLVTPIHIKAAEVRQFIKSHAECSDPIPAPDPPKVVLAS